MKRVGLLLLVVNTLFLVLHNWINQYVVIDVLTFINIEVLLISGTLIVSIFKKIRHNTEIETVIKTHQSRK